MRILVLSDTHIPVMADKLPHSIIEEAKNSEICLHAGDFIEYALFEELSSYTKTVGVYGNMDNDELRKKLSRKKTIQAEDVCIALIHGSGSPTKLISLIDSEFSEDRENIDLFIFGHSHQPFNKKIGDKLYFNPGSPLDKMFSPYNSYGIIEIEDKNIEAKIVKL